MPSFSRRGLVAAALLAPLPLRAAPAGPITLVVPFAAGGPADQVGRAVAEALAAGTGQVVRVENRPGGNALTGAAGVARAAPDGTTLLLTSSTIAIGPAVLRNVPFVVRTSLAPVAIAVRSPMVVVVPATRPIRSMLELLAAAPVLPLSFVSGGRGTPAHLGIELIAAAAHARILHMPMRGEGEAIRALAEGEADGAVESIGATLRPVREGTLRALAVTTATRSPLLPRVPTLAQAGIAGVDVSHWYGLFAPAAVPASLQDSIHAALTDGLGRMEPARRLAGEGLEIAPMSRLDSRGFFLRELDLWSRVARERNIVQG
jgi:tripartite-type tricarboxylate transporter receptor subunit TctC